MATLVHASAALLALAPGVAMVDAARAELVETRTLEETVPVRVDGTVVVENVFGSIRVRAHDASTVSMTATETIRAETQAALERARAEVGLRTTHDDEGVSFRVARPTDEDCECDCDCRWHRWRGFVVAYDIELRVPRDVSLKLSTVNEGEIVVDDVRGDFVVSNVNGPVQLRQLHGAGRATTVNGRLDVSFERAPAGETTFKTVNGRIEVAFPSELSADLSFKTMRGNVWSDFEVEPLPVVPVQERTSDGDRLVIRAERRPLVRVASGGPTHSFETLNGDIYVREVRR